MNFLRSLYFLLLICNICYSQNIVYKGKIIDKKNNQPIPYSHIIIGNEEKIIYGTLSDENGNYSININLDSINIQDSIIVSCIGFNEIKSIFNVNYDNFYLAPKIYNLKEVTIKNRNFKKKEKRIGFTEKHKIVGGYYFGYGSEIALYLPNKKKYVGLVSKVYLYITNEGYPNTKFRINFYDINSKGEPANRINDDDIILNTTFGNEWLVADILNFNIEFPLNGLFISMEWLPESKRYNNNERNNGQVLGSISQSIKNKQKKYIRSIFNDWIEQEIKKYYIINGEKIEVINQTVPAMGISIKILK